MTPLETATVLFGLWTVGFWLSLPLALGWVAAVAATVVLTAGLWIWLGRPTPSWRLPRVPLGDLITWAALAAFAAMLWPHHENPRAAVLQIGEISISDAPIVVGLVIGACLLMAVAGAVLAGRVAGIYVPPGRAALGAGAAAVATASYFFSWSFFVGIVALVTLAVLVLEVPQLSNQLPAWTRPTADVQSPAEWKPSSPTMVSGALLGLWVFVTPQPNLDDIYYLNKSAHYADSPWRFRFEDHLFGVEGIRHLSTSDFISSYEPLVGFLSALSNVSASLLRASIVAPLAAAAIPFALRYAARSLDARRPDLVAVVASMPLLLAGGSGDAFVFADKMAQGKGVAALALMPVLLGAAVRTIRDGAPRTLLETVKDRRTLVVIGAAIGLYGLTGSSVVAALALVAAVATAAWVHDQRVPFALITAAVVLFTLGVVGYLIEPATGVATTAPSTDFDTATASWAKRAIWTGETLELTPTISAALLPLSLVGAMFVSTMRRTRLVFASLAAVTFVGLFNPLLFDAVIVDILNLGWLSWRFGWLLPLGLPLGMLVDRIAAAPGIWGSAAAATVLVGLILTGTAQPVALQGAAHDLRSGWVRVADDIIDATPVGGSYLAPSQFEWAVSTMSADHHPIVGREFYLNDVPVQNDRSGALSEFNFEARHQLMFWMRGNLRRATEDPGQLLAALQVDTVCLPPRFFDGPLGLAVREQYQPAPSRGACEVWVRDASAIQAVD